MLALANSKHENTGQAEHSHKRSAEAPDLFGNNNNNNDGPYGCSLMPYDKRQSVTASLRPWSIFVSLKQLLSVARHAVAHFVSSSLVFCVFRQTQMIPAETIDKHEKQSDI